jgi:hypothetical protein
MPAAAGVGVGSTEGGGQQALREAASGLGAGAFETGLSPSDGDAEAQATPDVRWGDEKQTEVAKKAVHAAEALAQDGVDRLRSGLRNARDEAVATYNLMTREEAGLAKAESMLSDTLDGLRGTVPVYIDPLNLPYWPGYSPGLGYVWGFPGKWTTDIHISPAFFEVAPRHQAWAMLHEATHRWGGARDHGYYKPLDTRPEKLTAEQALENADSLAAFCSGVVGDQQEHIREGQREAAQANAAALFSAWERGDVELYTDGWVTPSGLDLPAAMVADAVFAYFQSDRPDDYAEVARATAEQDEGPFTCSSGLVVRKDLFEMVYGQEQGFGGWR